MGRNAALFGHWVRDYWRLAVGLITGIASLALTIFGALPDTPPKAIGFWVSSYVCLVAAAWVLTLDIRNRLDEAVAKLEMRGFTAAREQVARERLAGLSEKGREVLLLLLLEGPMWGARLYKRIQGVDALDVYRETPFLDAERQQGIITDHHFSIREDWKPILNELLLKADPAPGDSRQILSKLWQWIPVAARVKDALAKAATDVVRAMKNEPDAH